MALRAPREIAQSEPSVVRQERAINKQTVQELLLAAVQKHADTKLPKLSDPTKLEAAYDASSSVPWRCLRPRDIACRRRPAITGWHSRGWLPR